MKGAASGLASPAPLRVTAAATSKKIRSGFAPGPLRGAVRHRPLGVLTS